MSISVSANQRSRPFVIEVAGMPGAGKDTCIRRLVSILQREKRNVLVMDENARHCPYNKVDHFAYERWNCHRILNRLMEIQNSVFQKHEFILFNRGLFDLHVFLRLLYDEGDMNKTEYVATIQYLSLRRIAESIDRIFVFVITPQLAIRRDDKKDRPPGTGRIVNPQTLKRLRRYYVQLSKEEPWKSHVRVLNVQHFTRAQTLDAVHRDLRKHLKEALKHA